MKRMKTFLIYLLLVITLIVSTDFIAKFLLETNYKDILNYEITTTSPEIVIKEAKAGRVNAKIKGTVTNKTNSTMDNVFLKIELKSELNNLLGTESIKVGSLKPEETKDFLANCKYSDIESFIISVTNEEEKKTVTEDPTIANVKKYYPIVRLVAWAITPAVYFIPLFLFTGR